MTRDCVLGGSMTGEPSSVWAFSLNIKGDVADVVGVGVTQSAFVKLSFTSASPDSVVCSDFGGVAC